MVTSGPSSPQRAAAELRAEAARAEGARKAYLLWLADEWEKTAGRLDARAGEAPVAPPEPPAKRRPRPPRT